ncbi:Putative Phage virion morphogenesis protein [Avibacterium paragallinarum JF4211]|nr:Putative Phage virion morphogenesis protein [Avibacterium paragallinarum JF4211]
MFSKLSKLGKTDGLTRKIANVLWKDAEDAFDNECSPEGEKWATLKEPYKSQRYKKGYTGSMLQVTGTLAASLTLDYGENFAVIGTQESYGQYHQAGTIKMAARPFLGLSDDGVEEIKDILHRTLKQATQS